MIQPQTGGGWAWAEGSFDSVYGTVASAWKREGDRITLTVTVPVNAAAAVILERGAEAPESELPFVRNGQGLWQAETGSGVYTVTYRLNE